jgi:hypothetical protein
VEETPDNVALPHYLVITLLVHGWRGDMKIALEFLLVGVLLL